MLAEQVINTDENPQIPSRGEMLCSDGNPECGENEEGHPITEANEDHDQLNGSENQWLSQWWGQSVFMVSSVEGKDCARGKRLRGATEEKVESYLPERIYRPRGRSRMISAPGIVDSGGSWSIAGLPWVKKWSNLTSPEGWRTCDGQYA